MLYLFNWVYYIDQSQREQKNTWDGGPEAKNATIPKPRRTLSKSSKVHISEGQPLQTCGKPSPSQHDLKVLTRVGGLVEISADPTLRGRPCGRVTSQSSLTAQCVTEALVYAPFQGLGWGQRDRDTHLKRPEPGTVEVTLAVMMNHALHSIPTAQGPCTRG